MWQQNTKSDPSQSLCFYNDIKQVLQERRIAQAHEFSLEERNISTETGQNYLTISHAIEMTHN